MHLEYLSLSKQEWDKYHVIYLFHDLGRFIVLKAPSIFFPVFNFTCHVIATDRNIYLIS